jgi:hypothetical protein
MTTTTYTIGELAKRIDITPREVLDACIEIGVKPFWHEGQQFRDVAFLRTYLAMRHYYSPVPELEFELSEEQEAALAEALQVEVGEILFQVRS